MLRELIVLSLGLMAMFVLVGCEEGASAPVAARPAAPAPAAKAPSAPVPTVGVGPFSRPGFVTFLNKNVLTVFHLESKDLPKFRKSGDMAKGVIRPAAGPEGLSLKAPDGETIQDYLMTDKQFIVRHVDGRLWVFRNGSAAFGQYVRDGELAKNVTRVGAGPSGMTLKAPDIETLNLYVAAMQK